MKKMITSFLSVLLLSGALSTQAFAVLKYAKVNDFILIHPPSTIEQYSGYKKMSQMSDYELQNTVKNPAAGDYVTVKHGTMSLRDGNTRVYLLKKRGYGTMVIPYDELDTSVSYYDDY